MQANDRLYIFKCGHVEWNPDRGPYKVYKCSKCRSGLNLIIKKCLDCNKWLLLRPAQGKQKRCKPCSIIDNRERQIGRKRDNRKRNAAHRRQTAIKLYQDDVEKSLTHIAEYFGISKERARQIEAEAVAKFRKEWLKRHPDDPNPLDVIHETRRRHDLNAA
jgi:hypothetical protein